MSVPIHELSSVAIGLASFLVSFVSAQWIRPLGGLIYAAFALPSRIPVIGSFYEALLFRVFRLSFLVKLISFIVSASGILIPLTIGQYFFPDFFHRHDVLWGVLIASLMITLDIMHGVHLMELPEFYGLLPAVEQYTKVDFSSLDERTKMRLIRTHFADMTTVNLFMIVICYGVATYCGSVIGLFGVEAQNIESPLKGVGDAFTWLKFLTGQPLHLSGPWGLLLNVFYGASLLIFTVFFISLASKIIDVPPPTQNDVLQKLEQQMLSIISNNGHPQSDQSRETKQK